MKKFNPEKDSLIDFIRLSGGISTKKDTLKGEIRACFSIQEGYNLINNKTGKTLDTLLMAAIEVGFCFFDATITDLLDLMRQDLYAKKYGKKGGVWSYQKQNFDGLLEPVDFEYLEEEPVIELEEEIEEAGMFDLMPEWIFNLYYGGVNYA